MATNKSKDPEIEINAKIKGSDEWKKWGNSTDWKYNKKVNSSHSAAGASGGLYFLGFVGALIYWMQAAHSFGAVIAGILKASVWPAYIVYKLLESFYGVVR